MYYKLLKDLPGVKSGTIFNCPEKTELTHGYHIGLSGKCLGEPEDYYFVSRSYVSEFPDFFEQFSKRKIGDKVSTTSDYDDSNLYFGVITGIKLSLDSKYTRYNVSFLGSAEDIDSSYLRTPTIYEINNFF